MSKYSEVALRAWSLAKEGEGPRDAWEQASTEAFGKGNARQTKSCPRCAFLAVASTGRLHGVSAGDYSRSVRNNEHTLGALRLIDDDSALVNSPRELWAKVVGENKVAHNHQLDVVLALRKAGALAPRS